MMRRKLWVGAVLESAGLGAALYLVGFMPSKALRWYLLLSLFAYAVGRTLVDEARQ